MGIEKRIYFFSRESSQNQNQTNSKQQTTKTKPTFYSIFIRIMKLLIALVSLLFLSSVNGRVGGNKTKGGRNQGTTNTNSGQSITGSAGNANNGGQNGQGFINGNQQGRGSRGKYGRGTGNRMGGNILADATQVVLTETEIEELQYMREEEKMARDTYQTFFLWHGVRIFENIAKSEQHHMDLIKTMLDIQGLDDPVGTNGVGVFTNPDIQSLYDGLIVSGNNSLTDALIVGGKIEEVDIADLLDAKTDTVVKSLDGLYDTLIQASERHLRAFVRTLDGLGEGPYVAQVLSSDEVEDILE